MLQICREDEAVHFYEHAWIPNLYDRQGRPVYIEKSGMVRALLLYFWITMMCLDRVPWAFLAVPVTLFCDMRHSFETV